MEPPTTPSPVSVQLALPKREDMYKIRVAICALSKSKPTWQYVHDSSVYKLFLTGIYQTTHMQSQYDITVHVGVDTDDVFWSKKDNYNALVLASARDFNLKLTVYHYAKKQPNHLPMNELMRDAARTGAEYLVRLNDDTQIKSMSWLPLAVHQLSAYNPPNVGVVGPVCREGKTSILTHDMVHRTHLEIFDTYYPPNFHNWYVDDWISAVYGPERTTKIPDWVVHHYVSPPRYNPIMVSNETLQASIREGKDRIQAYLSRRNVSRKLSQVNIQHTDQFQASLQCDGVSIVHQSSTTTEGSRETIFPAPKNNNMEQLCKKLKHWDFCRNKLSVITQRHPISKLNVITEWKNAYIDGGSCKGTLGFPFTSQCIGMFHGHCPHLPSNMLHGKTIHRYDAIATTLQHYYKSAGHWPAEQLPSLLRFLKELDQDVKILVSINDCKLCRKYINELVRLGVLKSQDRLINWEGSKQDHSHVYFGKRVFHHYPWPWENGQNPYRAAVLRGPQDLELVRSTFLGRIPEKIVPASDGKIVVIQRIESRRHTINHDKLVLDLRKIYSNVVIFSTPGDTLQEDVEVFRDASAVIAVHGAGLMNMLWCSPGTVVVEVCYTSGMPCPDMYYFMAVNLQLDYYVSVGSGDYNGGVSVDVADITLLLKKSLKSKTFSKKFREKKHTWLSQEKAFQHEVSVLQRLNSVTPPCGQSHIPRILNLDMKNLIMTTPWYGPSLNKPEGMKQFCEMELKSITAWAKCVDDHLAVANVSYHDHHGSGQNLVISESQLTLIDFGIADMDNQKRLPSKYLNHKMSTRELTREIYTKHCVESKQDKSAAVFIFADTNSAKTYAQNINSFRCYVSRHSDYELVVMSEDDKEFSDGCINKDSKFVRHCMLSNYMLKHPEIRLFFHLDADHAIMDISRRIETFVSGEKDLTFEIRFHIGEITVGSYIAKNTEFSRSFLRELSHTESMRKDNEALQTLILKRVELKNSCPTTSDYFKFVKCFHETIRQSGCQHDFWTRHADVLTPPHSFTYDGWLTKYQYSPKTFIHHAMKNPPIGGKNNGRVFPDVLENGCKMPDNDPYRISPEQEDHLLQERIDSIQSIWNANGLYNTSCILFKDRPTSPATASRSTRVWGGR